MTKKTWAMGEAKNMTLKDKRRNARVAQILEVMADNPEASIAQACKGSLAETKAAYRMIGSTAITEQDILQGHYVATVKRIKSSKETVLIASDGMDVSLNNLVKTRGLGPTSNSSESLGIKLHNTYAISAAGDCFGLIDQEYWVRNKESYGKRKDRAKKPIAEKESNYWLMSLAAVEERLPLDIDYVYLADGAADILEFFTAERRSNSHLIIHQAQNRKTSEGRMFDVLDQQIPLGVIHKKLRRTPNSPERVVQLEIKATAVQIMPSSKTNNQSSVGMNILIAKEIGADKPGSKKIIWRLITTIPALTLADAEKVIDLYTSRWLIERFHYVLKEGFNIERLQMESYDNLKRAIALYSIVAWRVMYITYMGRTSPDHSAEAILSEDEWKALWCYRYRKTHPPKNAPSIHEAVRMLAKLGGFLGRKGDGEPGSKVLWRGIIALEHITTTYLIFRG